MPIEMTRGPTVISLVYSSSVRIEMTRTAYRDDS